MFTAVSLLTWGFPARNRRRRIEYQDRDILSDKINSANTDAYGDHVRPDAPISQYLAGSPPNRWR
jgi:hypothetical protein